MALADELVAAGLGYGRARLEELRDEALADAQQFADAAGVPAFDDAAGTVANHLANARNELDQVPPSLAANDFAGAASHLANALNSVDQAAAVVAGKSLLQLLADEIGWGSVSPTGLAKQLGLPATVPGLQLTGGALVYAVSAPGKSLLPAPLTLGFDGADLSARLRIDGGSPPFSVALALRGIEAGVGAGEISSLLGGAAGSVQADVVLGVDTVNGLTVGGGASPRVVLPARPKLGPLDLREIALELDPGRPNTIDVGCTVAVDLGGVIKATVDGAGIHVNLDPGAVGTGANPITVTPEGADRDRADARHRPRPRRRLPRRATERRLRRRAAAPPGAGRGQGGRPADTRAGLRARRRDVDRVPAADRPELRLHPQRGRRRGRHRAPPRHATPSAPGSAAARSTTSCSRTTRSRPRRRS